MRPNSEARIGTNLSSSAALQSNGTEPSSLAIDHCHVLGAYQKIVARQATVIDVRAASAFANLRIPDARNIPLEILASQAASHLLADLKYDAQICVYCDSGARSIFAAKKLKQLGYEHIFYIEQGFAAWQAAGLPCVTEIDGELVRVVIERVGIS